MNINKKIFTVVVTALFLTACGEGVTGSDKDIPYYDEHKEEREEAVKWCGEDLNRYKDYPNCINAEASNNEIINKAQLKKMTSGKMVSYW